MRCSAAGARDRREEPPFEAPKGTDVNFQPPPDRHWRPYGGTPLTPPAEALDEPFRAFPSWFLKITCDRCGKDRMLNEVHAPGRQRDMPLRVLLARMRHDG